MIPIPVPNSASCVADWVELCLTAEGEPTSRTHLAAAIAADGEGEVEEPFLADVWRKLEHRNTLYLSPRFKLEHRAISPEPGCPCRDMYTACLILSAFGVTDNDLESTRLFERIACAALSEYVRGTAFHFGAPTAAGQQPPIAARIESLAQQLHEVFVEAPAVRFNDRGVDSVCWNPFSEGRSGQVAILLQSVAGRDWKNHPPAPLEAWRQYLKWACDPMRAFAVPCIVSADDWHDQSRDKGLILDRARIVNLLSNVTIEQQLQDDVSHWIARKLLDIAT